ncbi:acyltransferase [Komarekiella sp. 'clone 1']|uniref:Acyltransferase n=1 Tax=Komarekiella delphini-convector SJRDD-AB1 TaxID=2593771 RepID=A0AA40T4H3_9NOST|nr:acyltransferase [Komarekiella delphini-convector]MBD6620518.1 acyltransferase [Komarekiella delphini-convector SJRDD-AB1]
MPNKLFHQLLQSEISTHQKIDRLFPIDLLKAISIVAVVSFHSTVVPKTTYINSQLYMEILFSPLRFCVPVFLVIYFLLFEKALSKHKVSTLSVVQKRLVRILIPTMFWFSITALLKLINKSSWIEVFGGILNGEIFTGGYYLLIILQFIPFFAIFRPWFSKQINVFIAIMIQSSVYIWIYTIHWSSEFNQIVFILKFIHRPLFIYWFVYMVLGIYCYKKWSSIVKLSSLLHIYTKVIILVIYTVLQGVEAYYAFVVLQGDIPPFDYAMFSCMLSVLVMFICFASIKEDQVNPLIKNLVSVLSKYSLGIFCINGILYQLLSSLSLRLFVEVNFNFLEIIIVKLLCFCLLLSISLVLSMLLERMGLKVVVC